MLYFFVGFMGSGKTYWAKKLSEQLGIPTIDLDAMIEQEEKLSIHDLFTQKKEQQFRKLEHHYLIKIIEINHHVIVSCGGGTPCFFNNMNLMKKAGRVYYLQQSTAHMFQHLTWNDATKPLTQTANKSDFEHKMIQLMKARESTYLQAHTIIDANTIDAITFAKILKKDE